MHRLTWWPGFACSLLLFFIQIPYCITYPLNVRSLSPHFCSRTKAEKRQQNLPLAFSTLFTCSSARTGQEPTFSCNIKIWGFTNPSSYQETTRARVRWVECCLTFVFFIATAIILVGFFAFLIYREFLFSSVISLTFFEKTVVYMDSLNLLFKAFAIRFVYCQLYIFVYTRWIIHMMNNCSVLPVPIGLDSQLKFMKIWTFVWTLVIHHVACLNALLMIEAWTYCLWPSFLLL